MAVELDAARAEAAEAKKPVFVYFTAEWCGPCQELRRTTWSDKRVETALQAFVPVRIDIDQNPALAQRYNVESIPWFGVLDKNGRAVRVWSGWMGAEEFMAWLKG